MPSQAALAWQATARQAGAMDAPTPESLSPHLSERRAAQLADAARQAVRRWLALARPGDAAEEIAAIGSSAITAAADASRRMAALDPAPADARAVLDALHRLAERAVPASPPRWLPFRKAAPAIDLEAELANVMHRLDEARDALIRAGTRLAGELDRTAAADARLDEVVHLLKAMQTTTDAAARELAATDPARARKLSEAVAGRLEERLGDLLTQLAVTRQARLSLELIRDGNATLAGAVERARSTVVAALRTAGLAGRAAATSARLLAEAAALDRGEAGAPLTGTTRQDAVRRAIDDAIAEVAAAQAVPSRRR